MSLFKKIYLVAGGTGGHIFPAYSLTKYFLKKNIKTKIITDERGVRFLKNYPGLQLKIIKSTTIFKKNPINFIISLFVILYAFINSLFFLFLKKPNLIFGMGGYTSFPTCIAAKILGIPFVIYENNLILGKTNKYLLPFAKKIFVSNLDITGIAEKYKSKVLKSGNIIREEMLKRTSRNIYNNDHLRLMVLGGSQGAKIFGEKIPFIFQQCQENNIKIKIIQQCQKNQNKVLDEFYRKNEINFELFNFTENILDYFNKTDLVITRSGSSVIAELINCRLPFIAIPLPSAADNHQYINAKYFEKKGCNFTIEEKELENNLFPLIKSIHKDKSLLIKITKKQEQYSDLNVFENINLELNKIINEKN